MGKYKLLWAACVALSIIVPIYIICNLDTQTENVKGNTFTVAKEEKNIDADVKEEKKEKKKKKEKDTSKYVHPAISWSAISASLLLAAGAALYFILPLL